MSIKVLFLAANPAGTPPLALSEEIRTITHTIRAAEHRELLEVVQAHALRPRDLRDRLLKYHPDVVHFSGHGTPENEIILLDKNGDPKPVSKAGLVDLLRIFKEDVKVVILNACFSEAQAEEIVKHIPCAIGMDREIGDHAAIEFAASFYSALASGCNIKKAFELGVNGLKIENIPEEHTPRLFTNSHTDASTLVLVNPESEKDTKEPEPVSNAVRHRDGDTRFFIVGFASVAFGSLSVLFALAMFLNPSVTEVWPRLAGFGAIGTGIMGFTLFLNKTFLVPTRM